MAPAGDAAEAPPPELKVGALIQANSRTFFEDAGLGGVDGFYLRRVRPELLGKWGAFSGRLQVDFADGRLQLLDAYGEAVLSRALTVRIGKFKVPFGQERLQSAAARTFAELSFATGLAPNRDLGLQLSGELGALLGYQLGIFNGVADGAVGDLENSDGKELAARLTLSPFAGADRPALGKLRFAVAATYGRAHAPAPSGSTVVSELPTYRTLGRQTLLSYAGGGDPALQDGLRARLGLQGFYAFKRFSLAAEHAFSAKDVRRSAARARLLDFATSAWATLLLTDDEASERGVVPRRPVDAGGAGAWELAARAERLRLDPETFAAGLADAARSTAAANAYTLGVSWYATTLVKATVNYAHTVLIGRGVESVLLLQAQATLR